MSKKPGAHQKYFILYVHLSQSITANIRCFGRKKSVADIKKDMLLYCIVLTWLKYSIYSCQAIFFSCKNHTTSLKNNSVKTHTHIVHCTHLKDLAFYPWQSMRVTHAKPFCLTMIDTCKEREKSPYTSHNSLFKWIFPNKP